MLLAHRKVAAIVIGIFLASASTFILQSSVDRRVEQRGREEVEGTARRGIALAEGRIRRVITGLDALNHAGVGSCSEADRERLNAVTLDIMPIKELAVVDPNGETLCTNHGFPARERRVVSRHATAIAANILIEVVIIGDRRERMVRVRRTNGDGENGLAALIPSELLTPQIAPDGGLPRAHAIIATLDGTTIGQTGAARDDESDSDRLVATLRSENYGLVVTSSLSQWSLAELRSAMRALDLVADVGLLVLIALVIAFIRWRRRGDPLADVRRALEAEEFVPYYQPILDITNGRLEGAEVLARWRKSDGSIIQPGSFIPLLESSGLIFDVTRALMRRVSREAGDAIGRRPRCKISFNLTARHFTQESTVSEIREIFANSPIALSQLVLEVTERQPLENLAAARSVIAGLQELGARVAIDDVGAGHGGLSYLLKLGVDIIKVDKLFVDAIGSERHSTAIISSLVELARSMRMDVVAEGVESFEQVAYLRDQGIRLAQGYVFAPPLPGPSFLQLLEAADPVDTGAGADVPGGKFAPSRAASALTS